VKKHPKEIDSAVLEEDLFKNSITNLCKDHYLNVELGKVQGQVIPKVYNNQVVQNGQQIII